jgi:hypothetical protein
MMRRLSCVFSALANKIRYLLVSGTIAALLIFSCGGSNLVNNGGSGTGVGNGYISAQVLHPDYTPVKNAQVRLRSINYVADTSLSGNSIQNDTIVNTVTNSNGQFRIDSIRNNKTYFIEVLCDGVNKDDSGTLFIVNKDTSTVELEPRIIAPVKKIEGTIIISSLPGNALIQVYGIERVTRSNPAGKFELNDLPVGKCERNECEYKLKVTIPQKDGTVKIYNSELEIIFDSNNNIINTEFELEDD